MEKIQARKAKAADLESILLLSDQLTISDLPYDRQVDINWAHTDKGKAYYSEKIAGRSGVCFVAESGGKIVGYATAAEKEVPSYRLVKVAELENLIVDKAMRNQGIGKKLLDYFFEWARKTGADKVAVDVFTLNEKGIKFYQREGFLPFETILEVPLKDVSSLEKNKIVYNESI